MSNRPHVVAAALAGLILLPIVPAFADGEIQITYAKALAGNVTPGDAPGYPVIISIPGMFELASNLFVAANAIGIQVTSPYVTIDLNGFLMQGSNVAWYGIAGGVDAVTIKNGVIASFDFDGIVGNGDHWAIENMQVVDNGRHGVQLFVGGEFHRVLNSTISGNGSVGLRCGSCVIQGNVVAENGGHGIAANAVVIGNYIEDNGGFGLTTGTIASGFAHNVLYFNNGGGTAEEQVNGTPPLHPNICVSGSCD